MIGQATIEASGALDVGPAASGSGAYGPFNQSTVVNASSFGGTIDSFDLLVSFTGSGGNDEFSFTAIHEITASQIPEPSAITLLASGLLGMLAFRKRFRK